MTDYYVVNGKQCRRDWWQDDIVWKMKLPDGTFKHWIHDLKMGYGTMHGEQYMPPWIMNFNRYVVDDYGNLSHYLSNDPVYQRYYYDPCIHHMPK
jgi:hypothetical protein